MKKRLQFEEHSTNQPKSLMITIIIIIIIQISKTKTACWTQNRRVSKVFCSGLMLT